MHHKTWGAWDLVSFATVQHMILNNLAYLEQFLAIKIMHCKEISLLESQRWSPLLLTIVEISRREKMTMPWEWAHWVKLAGQTKDSLLLRFVPGLTLLCATLCWKYSGRRNLYFLPNLNYLQDIYTKLLSIWHIVGILSDKILLTFNYWIKLRRSRNIVQGLRHLSCILRYSSNCSITYS